MEDRFLKSKRAVLSIFMLFSLMMVPLDCFSGVIFSDNFDTWPSDWKCTDGNAVPVAHGWGPTGIVQHCASSAMDGFGAINKMGPGRTGNAYTVWIKPARIYSGTAGAGTGTVANCLNTQVGVCNGGFPTCYKLYDANANFGNETPSPTQTLSIVRDPHTAPGLPPSPNRPTDRWGNASCIVDNHTLYTFQHYWAPGDSFEIWYPPNNYRSSLNKYDLESYGHLTELYIRYYIKTTPAFNKVALSGMKLLRLNTNNRSGFIINIKNNSDPYTLQTGTFGCEYFRSTVPLSTVSDGKWHSVEWRLKLNDPGVANGIYEIWVDGGATAHWAKTNADYGLATSDMWFTTIFAAGLGIGNYSDEKWNMSDWTSVAFDDFVISTDYIGPIGGPIPIKKDPPPAPPTGLKVVP